MQGRDRREIEQNTRGDKEGEGEKEDYAIEVELERV